jgi:hypothetical protein
MIAPIFTIYAQRYHSYDPFVLAKDMKDIGKAGDVIDDGKPKKIRLCSWADEDVANLMAENVKNNAAPRTWKVWVEKTI